MKIIIVHPGNDTSLISGKQERNLRIARFVKNKIDPNSDNCQIISSGSTQTQSQVQAILSQLKICSYAIWPQLSPYPKPFNLNYNLTSNDIIEKIIFESENNKINLVIIVLDENQKNTAELFFKSVCPQAMWSGFPDLKDNQIIEFNSNHSSVTFNIVNQ